MALTRLLPSCIIISPHIRNTGSTIFDLSQKVPSYPTYLPGSIAIFRLYIRV